MIVKRLIKLDISCKDAENILTTIERDIAYLKKNGLMDYSLLLGIEEIIGDHENDLPTFLGSL